MGHNELFGILVNATVIVLALVLLVVLIFCVAMIASKELRVHFVSECKRHKRLRKVFLCGLCVMVGGLVVLMVVGFVAKAWDLSGILVNVFLMGVLAWMVAVSVVLVIFLSRKKQES
ncbi:MAG: hypothetical protein FWD76_00290 [Firmicutes bacterium]|nr:hypothetical protein [Bacillota bacterium]